MSVVSKATSIWKAHSVYTRVTILGLLLVVLGALVATIIGAIEGTIQNYFFTLIILIIHLIVAGLVWKFGRWALIVAAVIAVLTFVAISGLFQYGLGNVDSFFDFVPNILLIVGNLLAFVGGISAFIQRHQANPRTVATRVERAVFGSIALVVVALTGLSGGVTITGRDTVAAEDKIGAIEMVMKKIQFKPDVLDVRGFPKDAAVRIVLKNDDLLVHTFTVKDLDIDVALGAKSEGLVVLTSPGPGTYPITCEVPGHEDMKGTLVITQ